MDQNKLPVSATAYRRQRQIEDCLFENLQQRPYPSVSVSDLCHQLGISRKSFYNYFSDKDSCFRSLINRKIHTCFFHLNMDLPETASEAETIAFYLSYWKDEKILFDVITRNNLLYLLIDQFIVFVRDENDAIRTVLDTPELKADEYVMTAFATIQITLLMRWYQLGFSTPLEEMVRTFQRLVLEPMMTKKEKYL